MFTVENQQIRIRIHPKGAELQSIFHKGHQLEYMWSGDPAFWGKYSPLLFPIVGTLKGNTFYYQDKGWSLSRHGFARETDFVVEEQGEEAITFLLNSNASTKARYPFDFELRVIYQLTGEGLTATYRIKNPSAETLFFSVGAHPAFKVPLVAGTSYEDYYLEFNQTETAPRWPISKEGLIETSPLPLLEHTNHLPLTKELFSRDALVLKHASSTAVSLRSAATPRGLRLDFPDFPFLGLWAAPGADFLCIEPWCGIADSTDSNQQLMNKEGINRLAPGAVFERTWTLTLF